MPALSISTYERIAALLGRVLKNEPKPADGALAIFADPVSATEGGCGIGKYRVAGFEITFDMQEAERFAETAKKSGKVFPKSVEICRAKDGKWHPLNSRRLRNPR